MVVEAATRLHADGADSGRLLVLTLRPWLMGQPLRIAALEDTLRTVMALPHVWAATGSQIVEHFRARQP